MRNDIGYLEDVIEAIQRIERYSNKGREAFDSDELIQTWMIHHIQLIGEAVGKISEELKARHPEVPWLPIKAMRNVLVHFYFGVNMDKIWGVVEKEIGALKPQIEAILQEAKDAEEETN